MLLPRQNRVTPRGEIIATPQRGTFMGNRGVLHDGAGRIQRAWQVRRWIVCVLEFRGRKRTVMTPGYYTELFFLDEATALAAGHRPCAECRRPRFIDYCAAWRLAHPNSDRPRPAVDEIDRQLHAERLDGKRSKRTFAAALDSLPDGVLVQVDSWGQNAFLLLGGELLEWSPGGYGRRRARPEGEEVRVLTPRSTVEVIRAGYAPEIHPSAAAGGGDMV